MRLSTRMFAVGILGAIASEFSVSANQSSPHFALLRQVTQNRKAADSAQQPGSQRGARWVGQDGHDFVGPNNRPEPSDVQDVHIILGGLDPAREVVFVDVTNDGDKTQWQYNAQSFSWKAELKRAKGSPQADLFIEPGPIEAPQQVSHRGPL